MPGMHSGLNLSNPVLVAAFRSALLHQGLTALLALATLAVIWAGLREWTGNARIGTAGRPPEAAARRLLRLSFGLLWIFDGILQAQPAMAAGLPGKVIAPAAATSPGWVRALVNWAQVRRAGDEKGARTWRCSVNWVDLRCRRNAGS